MTDNRPRIAVPQPTAANPSYNERCWQQYAHAIEKSGGCPVSIPLDSAPTVVANLATSCSGVLLPGSPADIHPQKYGEEPLASTAPPDPAREAVDELLLQDAFNLHKPVFGICYGHQAINVWRGGSLEQHLRTVVPHEQQGEGPTAHTVLVHAGFIAGEGLTTNAELAVNSSHHQAVKRVGDGLRVAAVCVADGTIEAVESQDGGAFLLGIQWHPERSYPSDRHSQRFFARFIEAAEKWHREHVQSVSYE